MTLITQSAVAAFGTKAKAKLANPSASGEPEDQFRVPFEPFLADLAELSGFPRTAVTAVGESSVSDLKTRPYYAVTVHKALVGFIELRAPGKGADSRKLKTRMTKLRGRSSARFPDAALNHARVLLALDQKNVVAK